MLASSIETGPERGLLFWAVALFLVLTAVYVSSIGIRAIRGASITGDEPFFLLTTESLLADRDLDLRNLPFRGVAWLLTAVWLTLAASSMACVSPCRMLWRKVLSLMPNLGECRI